MTCCDKYSALMRVNFLPAGFEKAALVFVHRGEDFPPDLLVAVAVAVAVQSCIEPQLYSVQRLQPFSLIQKVSVSVSRCVVGVKYALAEIESSRRHCLS